MSIIHVTISFDLPYVESLKGRRAFLNAIKARLKKFNLSLLDVSSEYAKEATLVLVFLSHSDALGLAYLQEIEAAMEKIAPEIDFSLEYEFI
ncbi:MAG: DUF503 family protein [Epsilonproteobacteria bacterium]|nr:DUF503 family protein [Campylobacterota bacterium]